VRYVTTLDHNVSSPHSCLEFIIYFETTNCNGIIFMHVVEGEAKESPTTTFNEQSVIFASY
jgi:hypothetical protein